MKPRVFFIERPIFDHEVANEHGDIIYVFTNSDRRQALLWNPEFHDERGELMQRLNDLHFDPAVDVIAMAGHTVMSAMAIANVASLFHTVRVAFWDATNRKYTLVTLGTNHVVKRC